MQYQSIFTKHTYNHNDQEQTAWYKVGYLKSTPNGGKYIRFFSQPETSFYVFKTEDENLPDIQIEDKA